MKSKVKQLKVKEGFTVIELIVVIAILGILVLLAMFAFNGYTEKARIAQIKNDVKVAEGVVAEYLMNNNSLPDTWTPSNPKDSVSDIYDTRGLVDEVEDGDYRLVPKSEFNTRLPGNFHANNNGKVYYEDDRREESSPLTDDEIADLIDEGFIPVASADELQQINDSSDELKTWGAGTKFEMTHVGGLDQKYIQVQDIDLSEYDNWMPIGVDPDSPFSGIYNGGNYLINNLNIEENTGFQSAGLFGSVSNGNVIISNIKMRNVNVDINSNYSSMLIGDVGGVTGETTLSIMNVNIEGNVSGIGSSGGLIGYINNSEAVTIKDITIKSNISSTGIYSSAGGIIGEAYTDIDTIENVSIEGNISGGGDSGGLIGFIIDSEIVTIKDITIKSNISSTSSSVGGIIGEAHINIDTIKNITIEGDISSTDSSAGGIIGGAYEDIDTIKDITIKGDISSTGYSVGGIIGEAYININTIDNILIEGNISGNGDLGGLIGHINNGEVVTIKDITIKGDILSTDIDSSAGGLIGGAYTNIDAIENILIESIIKGGRAGGLTGGDNSQFSNIYDVKIINSEINGIKNSGGLFGSLYNSALINKVLIKDTVIKSDSSHSGGLVGEIVKLTASDITIENSNITGALSTGGIAGTIFYDYSLSGINIDKKQLSTVLVLRMRELAE